MNYDKITTDEIKKEFTIKDMKKEVTLEDINQIMYNANILFANNINYNSFYSLGVTLCQNGLVKEDRIDFMSRAKISLETEHLKDVFVGEIIKLITITNIEYVNRLKNKNDIHKTNILNKIRIYKEKLQEVNNKIDYKIYNGEYTEDNPLKDLDDEYVERKVHSHDLNKESLYYVYRLIATLDDAALSTNINGILQSLKAHIETIKENHTNVQLIPTIRELTFVNTEEGIDTYTIVDILKALYKLLEKNQEGLFEKAITFEKIETLIKFIDELDTKNVNNLNNKVTLKEMSFQSYYTECMEELLIANNLFTSTQNIYTSISVVLEDMTNMMGHMISIDRILKKVI